MVAMWGFSVYSHEHPHEDIACKPSVTEPELNTFPCKMVVNLKCVFTQFEYERRKVKKEGPL